MLFNWLCVSWLLSPHELCGSLFFQDQGSQLPIDFPLNFIWSHFGPKWHLNLDNFLLYSSIHLSHWLTEWVGKSTESETFYPIWSLSSEFFVRLFIRQLLKTEVLIARQQLAFKPISRIRLPSAVSHLLRDTLWHLRLDLFRGSD